MSIFRNEKRKTVKMGMKKVLSMLFVLAVSFVLVNADVQEVIKFEAADGAYSDRAGFATDIDGNLAVIGAYLHDNNRYNNDGAVYVYRFDGTDWEYDGELTSPNPTHDDEFGFSVAVAGNYIVVGARYDDENEYSSGAAYVFEKGPYGWALKNQLIASDSDAGDFFGRSVASDGQYILVGAPGRDGENGNISNSGAVYVYSADTVGSGVQFELFKIVPSDGEVDDEFGTSLDIDGDTAVIGVRNDDDRGSNAGSTYVYQRVGDDWYKTAKLYASDAAAGDKFGYSAHVSGDVIVVGAYLEDTKGTNAGSAYVYRYGSAFVWAQEAKLNAPDSESQDYFGVMVAIDGDNIVVGAPKNDNANGTAAGSVYYFNYNGSSWNLEETLIASDGDDNDHFSRVAISGNNILVGAPDDDTAGANAGSAYIFEIL
ncbi:MAG: hypothetical protein GY765_36385 [bacterium]|nr:hypothetical protein [bacterium]